MEISCVIDKQLCGREGSISKRVKKKKNTKNPRVPEKNILRLCLASERKKRRKR